MSGQLITIFGGSGFIGRHLVGRLAAKGYQVRIAVRDTESAAPLMTQGNVGQIVGFKTNVRNQASVERAVAGADVVINLVGILFEKGAQNFGRLHVDAAERIAAASRKAGVAQLIHMSALGVSKDHEAAYARSKAVGEELAKAEFPEATILRPSVVFGNDDDFFNRFAGILSLAPAFPLAGGGESKMQPIWVEDLTDAIVRIIETPAARGKTYELTGPDVYSFRELMEKVLEFTGRKCLLLPVPFGVMRAMSVDKLKECLNVFGPVMTQSFGQAEAPMFCTYLSPEEHLVIGSNTKEKRLASCGRQTLQMRVRIMDDEGNLLPANERGEIVVSGNLVMTGYYKNPEATEEVSAFGWHHTGDIGYVDDDGYVYIVDRKKDMIITGGFNVYPSEIEQVIWGHPSVQDCAVIGAPDEKWGEAVKAVVELKPGCTLEEEEVISLCKKALGSVKAPKSVEFWKTLPRTPVGKVRKKDIRASFWKEGERAI